MSLRKSLTIAVLVALLPTMANAQRTLSLEECRKMAVQSNKDIESARTKMEMADFDKKIAQSNWYPKISVTGGYMYNQKNIALINDDMSSLLQNAGTTVQGFTHETMKQLQTAILSNPAAAAEFMKSPLWQTVLNQLSKTDVSAMLNQLGTEMDNAFHLDIEHVVVGVVSLQQPVFAGGKIAAANKMAALARELSRTQYDQKYQDVLVNVDQSYWQIVSIANKLRMAEEYADLLHKLEKDVEVSIEAGVMTEADQLQIKVKVNEADMMKTKAHNGLALSKMLLCKQIGIDLNSEITLADEMLEDIPTPQVLHLKNMDQIYKDRPEIKSLDLASQIYDRKVALMRADMIPKIALTANYVLSNPSSFNGFSNRWGGMFNVGVMMNIPVFHGMEANYKTKKAKKEAELYKTRFEDAKNLINLQVNQLRMIQDETLEKLNMARSNMINAEENLRTAKVGFEEGVVPTNTALAAHTAWLKAQSEFIDAGIELQINNANLLKAEGSYGKDQTF